MTEPKTNMPDATNIAEPKQPEPTPNKDRVELAVAGKDDWELRELLSVPGYGESVVLSLPGVRRNTVLSRVRRVSVRGDGKTFELAYANLIEKLSVRGIEIL